MVGKGYIKTHLHLLVMKVLVLFLVQERGEHLPKGNLCPACRQVGGWQLFLSLLFSPLPLTQNNVSWHILGCHVLIPFKSNPTSISSFTERNHHQYGKCLL